MSEVRLIDANALKDAHIECPDNISFFDFGEIVERFLQTIDEQPTVDAVPVVRCGRCEYYSNEMNCCSYVNGLQNVTKTDYCSYGKCADGERRTE